MSDGTPSSSPIKLDQAAEANINNKSSLRNRLKNIRRLRKEQRVKSKLEAEGMNNSEVKQNKIKKIPKGVITGLGAAGAAGTMVLWQVLSKVADTVPAVTGNAISVLREAREIVGSMIDKREFFMKQGFITPEDVLNFSYEELLELMLSDELVSIGNIAGEIGEEVGEVASGVIEEVSER